MRTMLELQGRTIHRLWVNGEESLLIFETDEGDIAYRSYGDCCSESWFADITGVAALREGTVTSIEDVEIDARVEDGRSRQDCDEIYGVKFITNRGHAEVIFRNSSNGYYGGWLTLESLPHRPDGLVEITQDWSA